MLEFLASNLIARTAFLVLVFVFAMLVVTVVVRLAVRRSAIRSNLRSIARSGTISQRAHLQESKDGGWARLAQSIEKAGLSLGDTRGDKLREKLIAAGYTSPAAPKLFTLARLVLVLLLPVGYLLLAGGQDMSFVQLYLFGRPWR